MSKNNKRHEVSRTTEQEVEQVTAIEGKTTIRRFSISATCGPLPVSSELANYEKILPGTAERILKMAEEEQKHRHLVEIKEIEAQIKEEDNKSALIKMTINARNGEVKVIGRGHVVFLILHVLLIAACCFCVYVRANAFASLFFTAFVLVYLYSSGIIGKDKKPETKKK